MCSIMRLFFLGNEPRFSTTPLIRSFLWLYPANGAAGMRTTQMGLAERRNERERMSQVASAFKK
jgi:hypothetical protein